MDEAPGFRVAVSQNAYVDAGDTEMHAILTITATGLNAGAGGSRPEAAEVLVVDCSGSMDSPPTKIAAARRATEAAVDVLRDGVLFAVVEGTHQARMVYPPELGLARADDRTRQEAKAAARRLIADGGTAMSRWLRLAEALFDLRPDAVRHAILLTDGMNGEPRQVLDGVLAACAGKFTCDARGIGDGWRPAELKRIATVLHGEVDAVREPAELPADFTSLMETALDRVVADLKVEIKTMPHARLRFVKQTFPVEADLTEHATRVDDSTTRFSTGTWGDDVRAFHVCLDIDADDLHVDEERQAARVRLVGVDNAEGEPLVASVMMRRTDDLRLSSLVDPKVAHYLDETELGEHILAGCEAYDAHDRDRAAAHWGDAVALATRLRNEKTLTRLHRLVEVIGDPADGKVRVRPDIEAVDRLRGEASSIFASMAPAEAGPGTAVPVARAADLVCAECKRLSPSGTRICSACGTPFPAGGGAGS